MEIKPPRDKFDLDAVAALAGVDGATLRPHQQAFDAELAAVLRSDDAVWKVSLLAAERIAACPTAAERAEGVDEAARDFLARRRQPEKGF